MRRPVHPSTLVLLAFLSAASSLLLPASSGFGQNPLPPAEKQAAGPASPGAEEAVPATEEGIDRKIGQIRARLAEIRLQPGPGQDNAAGSGMTPDESAEWRRLNLQLAYLLESREQALKDLKALRHEASGDPG